MKISSLSIGVVAAMLAATSALAVPTINITRQSGYYSGSGGEFTIKANAAISYSSYSTTTPVVASGAQFQTFCVETGDFVTLGNNYTAYVAPTISGANGTKTLSVGAAWLYANFLAGTLGGYNYTAGSGRSTSAGLLQSTIWYLMGEASNPGGVFLTDLTTAGITTPTAAMTGAYYSTTVSGTIYDVAVLNLGSNGDSTAQDQLVAWTQAAGQTATPDGGTTVSLLGMALAGLGIIGRRFAKR